MKCNLVYCNTCNDYIRPVENGECLPLIDTLTSIIPCPCCYGWGIHEGWTGKPVCKTCGGKRMVIKKIIYERVENILQESKNDN